MHGDGVEAEEAVGLLIVADVGFDEERPLPEVFLPVAELHVEAAVHALKVHLAVETFPAGHGAGPRREQRFGSTLSFFSLIGTVRI